LQARDNVKFLTTLERHFRSISTGSLAGILDTLPPLMNALRMVWIISRHYSDDARMGALFARIANELCDRVNGAVMLRMVFRVPAAEAIEVLRVSKAVLEGWQSTYMQVRRRCCSLEMCQSHSLQLYLCCVWLWEGERGGGDSSCTWYENFWHHVTLALSLDTSARAFLNACVC
jgi:hypothetical protein